MHWPFKTTAKFLTDDGRELRLEYLVSANNSVAAKYELERRLMARRCSAIQSKRLSRRPNRKQRCSSYQPAAFSC
jgi:hypothetical protein